MNRKQKKGKHTTASPEHWKAASNLSKYFKALSKYKKRDRKGISQRSVDRLRKKEGQHR